MVLFEGKSNESGSESDSATDSEDSDSNGSDSEDSQSGSEKPDHHNDTANEDNETKIVTAPFLQHYQSMSLLKPLNFALSV